VFVPFSPADTDLKISGSFAEIFDQEDYLAMANSPDEASVVLKSHLIFEEFLNIWASKITQTSDLFDGTFVPFKTKLVISKNLGLSHKMCAVLDRLNEIRNRYSHRRKFRVESSALESLAKLVDELESNPPMLKCRDFQISLSGLDQQGVRRETIHHWNDSPSEKKILIITAVLVLKLVSWMQQEFSRRGVPYDLIAWPPNILSKHESA